MKVSSKIILITLISPLLAMCASDRHDSNHYRGLKDGTGQQVRSGTELCVNYGKECYEREAIKRLEIKKAEEVTKGTSNNTNENNIDYDSALNQIRRVVLFDSDSAKVTSESHNMLIDLAKNMNAPFHLLLTGHTDRLSSSASNQALSVKRAKSVRKIFTENGISSKNITVRGLGERYPQSKNCNSNNINTLRACLAVDRRVIVDVDNSTLSGLRKVIMFSTGSTAINNSSKRMLRELAKSINSNYDLDVVGHADNRGKSSANKAISMKRAKTVEKYLISKGVAKSNISVRAMGDTLPINKNCNAMSRLNQSICLAKNRRVLIDIK